MSRHRIVRRMNYDEEYEGYDDVYGRSAEDDHCISPTAAEFLYDRNARQNQMAAFIPREDIPEEEPDEDDEDDDDRLNSLMKRQNSLEVKIPELNAVDEARLRSCLDEIRNVVGDAFTEQTMINAVMSHGFNLEKSLDSLLSAAQPRDAPKPQRERRERKSRTEGPKFAGGPRNNGGFSDDAVTSTKTVSAVSIPSSKPPITGFVTENRLTETKSPESDEVVTRTSPVAEVSDGNQDVPTEVPSNVLPPVTAVNLSTPTAKSTPGRGREVRLDAEAEYQKYRGSSKDLINLVVIGHVDAGKSTLMGHLLCLVGAVSQKVMHKYEQESKKIGKASFMYAWVLDETGEERSRGVTMDVGYSKFETDTKVVTLLDAPGHKDFIPNMITGAAQAEVAILVVNATRGEFETGFEAGGQTREHALLARSLGVSQLAVVVNKLDMVGWSEERYNEIVKTLGHFLVRQAGFKESDVTYIPCSGLTGENLVDRNLKEEALKRWYSGPTLLDQIDQFRSPERPISKPFRLCVNDVFKSQGSGFSVSGKVETGLVQVGDRVLAMPVNEQTVIKGIVIDDLSQTTAFAGDQIVASLSGIDMSSVTAGSIICDLAQPIRCATRFRARIVVFNIEIPITKGFQAVLHYQTLCEPVVLKKIISQLHKSTGEATKKKPRCLTKHNNAIVELEVGRPICIEEYKDIKELGRFMLRSSGATVAAGVVTQILQLKPL